MGPYSDATSRTRIKINSNSCNAIVIRNNDSTWASGHVRGIWSSGVVFVKLVQRLFCLDGVDAATPHGVRTLCDSSAMQYNTGIYQGVQHFLLVLLPPEQLGTALRPEYFITLVIRILPVLVIIILRRTVEKKQQEKNSSNDNTTLIMAVMLPSLD